MTVDMMQPKWRLLVLDVKVAAAALDGVLWGNVEVAALHLGLLSQVLV